ncbi:uncharacterized protein LOC114270204 [Camellia sinensis]|uniref:uncharacterized protein LOC114270204 n=1 Tax=Camellia sinensis TaxID=4442 RepID=UPI0010366E92|nr:uncharacterized protein LOC114270204 [Camellia sinensis]
MKSQLHLAKWVDRIDQLFGKSLPNWLAQQSGLAGLSNSLDSLTELVSSAKWVDKIDQLLEFIDRVSLKMSRLVQSHCQHLNRSEEYLGLHMHSSPLEARYQGLLVLIIARHLKKVIIVQVFIWCSLDDLLSTSFHLQVVAPTVVALTERILVEYLVVSDDGLKEIDDSIANIELAVRYMRSSPHRHDVFKKCAATLKLDSKALVCLDVPTRWNSTYLMLEAAEKYEKAFN